MTEELNPHYLNPEQPLGPGLVHRVWKSKEEILEQFPSYFPPPWDIKDHLQKTQGWIDCQKAIREDPEYYLSDFLND